MAKAHKVGYYLCKSMRVPELWGKATRATRSSEQDSQLQDVVASGDYNCSVSSSAAAYSYFHYELIGLLLP